ncbi:MAG TPA: type II secretion system F family protein [Oligoflexia bacterium]|nr:type II secretion system F family protein [Oligoflexia bacterium]
MGISVQAQELMLSLAVACVVAFFYVVLAPDDEESLEDPGLAVRRRKQRSIFLKLFAPLIYVLGQFISVLPMHERREKLQKRLIQAGRPGGLSADEFDASRVIAVVLGFLAGSYFDLEAATAPAIAVALALLGFLYPDIWLKGATQKRRRSIFRTMPDILDILRLAVDAGLDLSSAFRVVVERGRRGPLLDELELVERDMALGRTRKDALRSFADRVGMTEINALVLALIQADQLGASIGPVLKTQAEMSRTKRWQLAEATVNKMPMKMLGPLVLFIFPSSFIILFTPLVIQWLQSD